MWHQLCRQVADEVAPKLRLEDEKRSPAEIDGHFGIRFVHRQQEAVALNAALVAERLLERLPERQRNVLDGVVLVDVEIARALHVELEAAVLAELLEHVVEEAEARFRARLGLAVEVDADADVGFLRASMHGGGPRPIDERMRNGLPRFGAPCAELDASYAEIARELDVGVAVAYDGRPLAVERRGIDEL